MSNIYNKSSDKIEDIRYLDIICQISEYIKKYILKLY